MRTEPRNRCPLTAPRCADSSTLPMTPSAVIIYNPGSGRRRGRHQAVAQMVETLQPRGLSVEPRATAAPGDATRLSRDALAAGVQTIVVHGGDGTVNEAMQPLVGGQT